MLRLSMGLLVVAASAFTFACSGTSVDDSGESSEDALRRRADDAWFYDGPLPAFQNATATLSLKGHTVRVSGLVPADTDLAGLPHVQSTPEDGKLRVDVVYPVATARPGKSNSPPGTYPFQSVKPYRPDGMAVTIQEGEHWVPWGGFPFVAYNGGIAFHGPISYTGESTAPPEDDIWFLMRGPVSGGCNRMAAEHIVEFTHIIGVSMRKVYTANRAYNPNTPTKVKVITDYDKIGDKFVDVDYPTYGAAVRPATEHGTENVVMFGSWVASETPDGRDHPPSMKWEGGVSGKYYVFREHVIDGMVCAASPGELTRLREYATANGGELPRGFCQGRTRPPTNGGGQNPGPSPLPGQEK